MSVNVLVGIFVGVLVGGFVKILVGVKVEVKVVERKDAEKDCSDVDGTIVAITWVGATDCGLGRVQAKITNKTKPTIIGRKEGVFIFIIHSMTQQEIIKAKGK